MKIPDGKIKESYAKHLQERLQGMLENKVVFLYYVKLFTNFTKNTNQSIIDYERVFYNRWVGKTPILLEKNNIINDGIQQLLKVRRLTCTLF